MYQQGGEVCQACPISKYSEIAGSNCTSCPSSYFQQKIGRSFCNPVTKCNPGTYVQNSSIKGNGRCADCPAGKYQPKQDQVACSNCEPGKYQLNVSQSYCESVTNCEPGSYDKSNGADITNARCQECPENYFRSKTDEKAGCPECASGKYTISGGASYCKTTIPCAPGAYDKSNGTDDTDGRCRRCPENYFRSNTDEKAGCPKCASGKYTVGGGASYCETTIPCAPGTYDKSNGANITNARCQECPKNYFRSGTDEKAGCPECPTGKYTTSGRASYCESVTKCGPGSFVANVNNNGNDRCAKCPVDHFSNKSDLLACSKCPFGKYQQTPGQAYCDTITKCTPGAFVENVNDNGNDRCRLCSAHTYQPDPDQLLCIGCPSGKFQTKPGMAFCSIAKVGAVSNPTNAPTPASQNTPKRKFKIRMKFAMRGYSKQTFNVSAPCCKCKNMEIMRIWCSNV
jgi:hypothetical protein